MTGIQWTSETWNPTTGCDRVSPGCDNCYALSMAARLKGMGQEKYQRDGDPKTSGPGFGITEHLSSLDTPLRWRKPRKVFVNSMSDLFHDGVTFSFLAQVFGVMAAAPQHTFQVLTKRHGRMRSVLNEGGFRASVWDHYRSCTRGTRDDWAWPLPNVHLGVSAEMHDRASLRIPALLNTPAAVRFVSAEPLLGPVELGNLNARNGALIDCLRGDVKSRGGEIYAAAPAAVDWVIVGGESGGGARGCDPEWVRRIVSDCSDARVPVFVKQLGSVWARDAFYGGLPVARSDPKGGDPKYWPTDLRVREFPAETAGVA